MTPGAITTGFDVDSAQRMKQEFETQPPIWVKAIPIGAPLLQTSFVSDSEFKRSDFYNHAVRPAGGFYGMVAPLTPDRGVYFVIGRDLGAADFSDADVSAARLILPHLATALQVQNRLAAADLSAKAAYEVISHLAFGVVLLDAAMRPIFVNPVAETLARCADGLLLNRTEVSAARPAEATRLRDAIVLAVGLNKPGRDVRETVAQHRTPLTCFLSRRPPSPPLVVHVIPVDTSDFLNGISAATRVILFVTEPNQPVEIDCSVLAATFGLTHREATLATLLARALNLEEAASQMGIGLGTARSYLKQILVKTGTHRQAELVSRLLRSGLPILR
ncbi:transcriptional regulator, LuxR family [Burkholderia cenocepacia]|uniref:Transcriptional regulator, LuxR family n=2 Tax=Burkholderia cepacia complex TaxID=87882 RepID=A0AAN0RY57_9BURK|nr:transcriptional regulator, LuxR family [Burkholderia cenocepacia]